MRRVRPFISSLLLAGALTACAAAPTQEMADARAALRSAEEAGGREYAGEGVAAAKKTLAGAERQLELGSFGEARDSANTARDQALAARNMALAIAEARVAVERAERLKGLPPAAEEALRNARAAARAGDAPTAVAEANRAAQLARDGENQVFKELARARLDQCAYAHDANKELVRLATEALEQNQGAAALGFATRACSVR